MVTERLRESYRQLEATVQTEYPDLRLVIKDDRPEFRGSFPIRDETGEIDRFSIEIAFPDGVKALPAIREIGGRIPLDRDRHVNVPSGYICADVPELVMLRGEASLLSYLNGPVRNFFLSQLSVESGKGWPFSQWDHGKDGLVQAYGEMLGVTGEKIIKAYLDFVSSKEIKGHWLCPCGSGRRIRDCHFEDVKKLRERIPREIARRAFDRLKKS